MSRDNEISAFPLEGDAMYVRQSGMTLRDWFAGQILVGACSSPFNTLHEAQCDEMAKKAYRLADSMLKERS